MAGKPKQGAAVADYPVKYRRVLLKLCDIVAADNDVADRIVEIRNMRPIEEACHQRYHVLLAEGSGRLSQEIGQEGIVTCIHGARL